MTKPSSPYQNTLGVIRDGDRHIMAFHSGVLGRPGFLHGGAIAGLLTVTCDATADRLGEDYGAQTTTMNFVRGGRERDTFSRAEIRARTARLLVVEATAWQESPDKPIAVMTRTYFRP